MAKKIAVMKHKYWYELDEGKKHESVGPIVAKIKQDQSVRSDRNLLHMRLYGNMEISGMGPREYFLDNSPSPAQKIKLNICKSVVDTVVSKIAKNRPRPMFLTDGADHKKKQRAKRLNKYVEGVFHQIKIYERGPELVRDAGVFDLGAWKFYTEEGRVCMERAFPDEIYVHDQEGVYKNPRSLFQVKAIAREVVAQDFPKFETEIANAPKAKGSTNAAMMTDLIEVFEAWHLPSKKGAKDGRHVICIAGADLLDEEYKLRRFPFVFWSWSDRLVGWYGQGIVEQLVGLQIEINRTLRTIQEAIKWSVPKVLVESGSNVTPMSNQIMGHWKYTGKKPDIEAFNTVPAILFEHLSYLYQKAFEIIGVSQMSAQSQKPAGLNSGRALREFSDIESDRFVIDSQRYEIAFLDAADVVLMLTRELAEEGENPQVRYSGKNGSDVLAWKDAEMSEDDYEMKMWPTNLLPQTPAGKLATVQEMMEAGLLSKEEGARLLDYPDVESVTSRNNAPIEIMDMIIEKLLDGDYFAPEPYFVSDAAVKHAQNAYIKAVIGGAPEGVLENMRRWIDQAVGLLTPPEPELPPVEAGGPPMPGAMPPGPEAMPMPPTGAPPPEGMPPGGMPPAEMLQ